MITANRVSDLRWRPVSEPVLPPEAPFFDPVFRKWRVTRHRDIRILLKQPDLTTDKPASRLSMIGTRLNADTDRLCRFASGMIVFQDGACHQRQKSAYLDFLPKLDQRWPDSRIRQAVLERLDAFEPPDTADLCPELVNSVMTAIAADVLGIPSDQAGKVVFNASLPWEAFFYPLRKAQYAELNAGLRDVFIALHSRNRAESHIPLGEPEPDGMRNEEAFLAAAIWLTSTTFLNHCIFYLSQSRQMQDALRNHPKRLELFQQEVLRLSPSASDLVARKISQPITLSEVEIPAGSFVLPDVRRSGHDPETYPDSDQIWLDEKRPMGFGFSFGTHMCLGQGFIRRVAGILLTETLSRFEIRYNSAQKYSFHTTPVFKHMMVDLQKL